MKPWQVHVALAASLPLLLLMGLGLGGVSIAGFGRQTRFNSHAIASQCARTS